MKLLKSIFRLVFIVAFTPITEHMDREIRLIFAQKMARKVMDQTHVDQMSTTKTNSTSKIGKKGTKHPLHLWMQSQKNLQKFFEGNSKKR
jgi:hypothetical protein